MRMLEEGHIFTIKTKAAQNVADIQGSAKGVVISGLNVLKEQIRVGDFIFVVFGGDKPKGWKPGLVGLAHIAQAPFDEGYEGKNFRVAIDVDVYFEPSIVRGDLVTYPDTFDTIGIGPITKWEPNQAITSVQRKNAIALLHAICDLRPNVIDAIRTLLGIDFADVDQEVNRYVIAKSKLGHEPEICPGETDFQHEFIRWWCEIKNRAGKTAKNYIGYLASLNKPIGEKTNSTWPGIYVYLFGKKSVKEVIQIGSLGQFDEIFGAFCKIFDASGCPDGADPNAYAACVQWVKDVSQWACLSSAFKAYREFLEWREAQQKNDAPVLEADLLSIALKMFAEKRYGVEWQSKTDTEEHQSIYLMSDLTPEQLAAGSLDDFYNNFLLKVWVFKNGGSRKYGQLDNAEKSAYRQFVVDLRKQLKGFDAYFPPSTKCPAGMGVGMLTEIMMRFWPKSCCSYNANLIHEALVTLGMAEGDFVWPKTPSIYQDFMGKCATILRKMEQMKLPRRPNPNNDEPPDYITVNEFLWFVHDYKDLIKEEVMAKEFKNAPKKAHPGERKLSDAVKDDDMLQRLMAALRTKPFAILAGHSGTGKSQLVRRLAYMTCNDEELLKEAEKSNAPGNYCMVQVKPNWHDSTDLLGYYTEMNGGKYHTTPFVEFICKAYAYPETPFFVCLDEMNLAPVEQYFAEFLSAIESYSEKTKLTDRLITEKASPEEICGETKLAESREAVKEHGLTIPRNLFVVGTVNVDETTCQFSRKVLDRAMTILMTAVSFKSMTEANDPSKEKCLDIDGIKFFLDRPTQAALVQGQMERLDTIQKQVGDSPFAIAYRFANEYALYQSAYQMLKGQGFKPGSKTPDPDDVASQKTAIDHVVLMKLLPRIHGVRSEMEVLFNGREGENKKDGLIKMLADGQSVEMMKQILARPGEYLSFWP